MWTIEPIEARHYDGALRAMNAIGREEPYFLPSDMMNMAQLTAWVAHNQTDNFPLFVAVSGEEVIGWSFASKIANVLSPHCASLWMGVSAKRRGAGLGRALLHATLEHAWQIGLTRVELEVYPSNARAVALYRSMGFADEGIKRRAHMIHGEPFDLMGMGILSPAVRELAHPALQAA